MHSQLGLDNLNVLIMIYKNLLDDACVDYLFIKEGVTNFIFFENALLVQHMKDLQK
jgi:hypothetical protein